MYESLPSWVQELLPIAILLAVITVVIKRLPRIDLGHTDAFRRRRFFNWFPLGMTYAFLYMGRYNLTVSKNFLPEGMVTNEDFGTIFAAGTITYGFSFLINGPLTDRYGGRLTIMVAAVGSSAMNLAMGAVVLSGLTENIVLWLSLLYMGNMYFQSFGAVSIVKVNAHWFHVRERGVFGGIFGILISLGIYFAFDIGRKIAEALPTQWVFFIPAIILVAMAVVDFFSVHDTPSNAGQKDFDTADASSGDDGPRLPVLTVIMKMASNPVIVIIAAVEFFSGFLRNAIMHWYIIFSKQTGGMEAFVPQNWGLLLCCAGIMGGVFAGVISDRVFQSRRGPVATVLYGAMFAGSLLVFSTLTSPLLGWVVIFMSLCVIGVHGMLSGTASMDFGGRKNVGVAVGIIDGFVYLGTGAQALILGQLLPKGEAAANPENWGNWPLAMAPAAFIGFLLATRVWNAKPKPKGGAGAAPAEATAKASP